MQGQGTHLGLQLLLLPADLLLRLLIELPHLVKMVRVSPAVTRGGTRQPLRTSGPLRLGPFCLACPERSRALSGHPGSMTLVIPLWISPPPSLSMVLIFPTLYPHHPQLPSRPHDSGQVCDPNRYRATKQAPGASSSSNLPLLTQPLQKRAETHLGFHSAPRTPATPSLTSSVSTPGPPGQPEPPADGCSSWPGSPPNCLPVGAPPAAAPPTASRAQPAWSTGTSRD